jgi:Membrane domain of glycerophosphoryl diester phosphodiesterase
MCAVASAAAPVHLRPMSLADLLDESFRVYRRQFTVLAGVALLVLIPGLVISLASGAYRFNPLTPSYWQSLIQSMNDPQALAQFQQRSNQVTSSPFFALTYLVGILLFPFTTGAVYRAATGAALGQADTIAGVLRATLRRYFGIFGLAILVGLTLLSGVLIVTIPVVVWVVVRWTVSLPALFAENVEPTAALRRSWSLVKTQWWRTLGIVFVLAILTSIVSTAVTAVFSLIAAVFPGGADLRSALALAGSTLASALVAPVFAVGLTLLYLDLRVRKEGLDLEQLARQA